MKSLPSLVTRTMDTLFLFACGCLGQACCWYRVFQCCGCIDDPPIQIERQATPPIHATTTIVPASNNPNPFLAPGSPKGPYFESAYKV